MAAKYLIRMDDICPTMNWTTWEQIEILFDTYSVKPILAIVPDNHDPKLISDRSNGEFWERVRQWQRKGWTIGLHGYRHRYETLDRGLVGLNPHSEFAGLSKEIQAQRIRKGVSIMANEGVVPNIWVAPGHSFDRNTVEALVANGIPVLSDGFFLRPVSDLGALWIPQQLWRFRQFPFGLWTVCYHHNSFSAKDLLGFESDILRFRSQIVSVNDVLVAQQISAMGIFDKLIAAFWLKMIEAKRWINAHSI